MDDKQNFSAVVAEFLDSEDLVKHLPTLIKREPAPARSFTDLFALMIMVKQLKDLEIKTIYDGYFGQRIFPSIKELLVSKLANEALNFAAEKIETGEDHEKYIIWYVNYHMRYIYNKAIEYMMESLPKDDPITQN